MIGRVTGMAEKRPTANAKDWPIADWRLSGGRDGAAEVRACVAPRRLSACLRTSSELPRKDRIPHICGISLLTSNLVQKSAKGMWLRPGLAPLSASNANPWGGRHSSIAVVAQLGPRRLWVGREFPINPTSNNIETDMNWWPR
jgi:hypothetical protein